VGGFSRILITWAKAPYRENKMKKIMVELADGTCGTISHDFLLEQLVGFVTTVYLPDENGTPIKVVGKIVDVLE